MRIVGITLHPETRSLGVEWPIVQPDLNAVYGPAGSGKTTLWEFLAHVLYGRQQRADTRGNAVVAPEGEILVESGAVRYRLRRCRDESGTSRLKIAAVDGAVVHGDTVRRLLHGLSPRVLSTLFAVSFETVPDIGQLLSAEFARDIELIGGRVGGDRSRRLTELAARRDVLAQELEKRISGERRASQDLEVRWRDLDRRVHDEQQRIASDEQRLHAIDAALAETDARLRYRRLELNTQLQLHAEGAANMVPEFNELDREIAKWRATLGEVSERESSLRGRLAMLRDGARGSSAEIDQRAWLALSRQLAADLAGEVARLARASQSQQCVCRDAHPRLRPISESIQRQLDLLQSMFEKQHGLRLAAGFQQELERLCRAQEEIRRHIEGLLDRRQSLSCATLQCRTSADRNTSLDGNKAQQEESSAGSQTFSVVDAEQLERRRTELEEQRYVLTERLRGHAGTLRDLRAQRDTVERQRASLLSARSIEHVQRELADVQRKLQLASARAQEIGAASHSVESPVRASDYLAQLTNGELMRLILVDKGRGARVVNRAGETLRVESLPAARRDQVYLSLCLALVSSAAQQGVTLPIVLDDPFARLDATGTAALATVLGDFCRQGQGHQALIFTGQPAAAERLASVGATVNDIANLRGVVNEAAETLSQFSPGMDKVTEMPGKTKGRTLAGKKRQKKRMPLNGKSSHADQSDAA